MDSSKETKVPTSSSIPSPLTEAELLLLSMAIIYGSISQATEKPHKPLSFMVLGPADPWKGRQLDKTIEMGQTAPTEEQDVAPIKGDGKKM